VDDQVPGVFPSEIAHIIGTERCVRVAEDGELVEDVDDGGEPDEGDASAEQPKGSGGDRPRLARRRRLRLPQVLRPQLRAHSPHCQRCARPPMERHLGPDYSQEVILDL